ncbi:MAG: metalloregulator ArsR/SmtB family transcription factor [Acidimicrobiia bacterium]|nr:metalloregulator ArsR/SmtB family transcription factor [Acidimicrobiia bacterium]
MANVGPYAIGGVTEQTQRIFAALSDPTRRAIFNHLTESGSATPTELADLYPISRQAVSKHLSLLGDAGLVTRTAQGRESIYTANPSGLDQVAVWMDQVDTAWTNRLQKLKRTVENT